MNSVYERDHVLVEIGDGGMADDVISIGHNFEAVLGDLETRMREAAADLNFEEAARLRDEVKRLRATELAVVDDPTIKQRGVAAKAGAYAGAKKYGESANLPKGSSKRGGNNTPRAACILFTLPWRGRVARSAGWGEILQRGRCVRLPRPQTPSRRNARPGVPALPPRRREAEQARTRHQQNLPAHRLAAIRPGVRPNATIERRRAGTSRRVEEEVGTRLTPSSRPRPTAATAASRWSGVAARWPAGCASATAFH